MFSWWTFERPRYSDLHYSNLGWWFLCCHHPFHWQCKLLTAILIILNRNIRIPLFLFLFYFKVYDWLLELNTKTSVDWGLTIKLKYNDEKREIQWSSESDSKRFPSKEWDGVSPNSWYLEGHSVPVSTFPELLSWPAHTVTAAVRLKEAFLLLWRLTGLQPAKLLQAAICSEAPPMAPCHFLSPS